MIRGTNAKASPVQGEVPHDSEAEGVFIIKSFFLS